MSLLGRRAVLDGLHFVRTELHSLGSASKPEQFPQIFIVARVAREPFDVFAPSFELAR
jgi:hypothetical protein